MASNGQSRTYDRDSAEFSRTLAFTDGLFAIAMTLLVVDLSVPVIRDTDSVLQLANALSDDKETFVSFFISFAVIGRYWLAHHAYISGLARIDRGLIALNLVYLAFIAFLPFPTAPPDSMAARATAAVTIDPATNSRRSPFPTNTCLQFWRSSAI